MLIAVCFCFYIFTYFHLTINVRNMWFISIILSYGQLFDVNVMIKQMFGFENYIRDVNIRTDRIIISKMRISNHRLAIETGRFSKTPRNERLCLFCKANNNFSEIEDEQHVLLRCSRYIEIRRDLFDRIRKCCPRIDLLNDENKLMYLLNSSGSTIKDVARFFHSAYKARSA